MFPNPQNSLPLPQHPDLERYKKLAKELLRAAKSTDPDAIRNWSTNWVKGLVERSGIKITPQLPVRTDDWIRDGRELRAGETVGRQQVVGSAIRHCTLARISELA